MPQIAVNIRWKRPPFGPRFLAYGLALAGFSDLASRIYVGAGRAEISDA